MVEFALVFPVAIVLLLGVFDIGRAVFAYNGLTNAAREGARFAAVNQEKSMVADHVEDLTFAIALSNAGDLDDLVSFRRENPNADPLDNAVCSPVVTGCVAVVTARADWSAITPIIGTLIGPIEFVARSELAVEFRCPNSNSTVYPTASACPRQP